MSKKRITVSIFLVIIGVLLNVAIINYKVSVRTQEVTAKITFESDKKNGIQMFYLPADLKLEKGFKAGLSEVVNYTKADIEKELEYTLSGDVKYLRLDFGMGESQSQIKNIKISYKNGMPLEISPKQFSEICQKKDVKTEVKGDVLSIFSEGEDPYIVWNTSDWGVDEMVSQQNADAYKVEKLLLCAAIDIAILLMLIFFEKFMAFPKEVFQNRRLILQLSKNDFKTKFAGSYLGIIWAFIQPIVTVFVYWFVFEKGLKAGASLTKSGIELPFVLWLVAGIVPWFFFSDALNGGTNALVEYSYLVKKVVFKIDILPIVKVVSALFVHVFFVVFALVLFAAYHYYPDLYTLQIVYYTFSMMIFVLGLTYATSAIVVFFRDLTQVINIVLQVGIWMTPIMWNIDTMELSPVLITILKLNPMYYIVAGYREALIDKLWFWENPSLTIYFWIITFVLFGIGTGIFKRLKVHFADVL